MATDPAFLSDRTLHREEEERLQREKDVHDKATRLRSDMSFDDMVDALREVDEATMKEFLWAGREYYNHDLGDLFSRQIQKYLRSVADRQTPEPVSIFELNQAD